MAKLNWSKVKQPCHVWPVVPVRVRKLLVDPSNPKSGYYPITGNRKALRKLGKFSEGVLGTEDHDAGGKAYALIGPASSGKSWTALHHVSKVLGLTFVDVSPEFKTADELFAIIQKELEKNGLQLVKQVASADQPYDYVLPPCGVFIDEAHSLAKKLQKGVLLKAIEANDRTLQLSGGVKVSTHKVHWLVGTTHFFDLFKPLRSRFERVKLVSHTKAELAVMAGKANKDIPVEVCERVAHYCRLPREVNDFIKTLRDYHRSDGGDLLTLVEEVARDNDIDAGGLNAEQVLVLQALKDGPVGKETLAVVTGLEESELMNEVLPGVMLSTPDMPALVVPSRQGYRLTPAGQTELAKRAMAA
ncbi:MAG: AAA family ATPase [Minisyncoccia bacterium]